MRIGICDDCKIFLEQAKSAVLSRYGNLPDFFAETFEDGAALIKAHSSNPFDIILLDVVMPLLNGIEAANEIRQNDKGVKIVFLTSSAEFAVDSYSVKASNYLMKPIVPEKLFECLDEIFEEIQKSSRSITIKSKSNFFRIELEKIEYIEAQNKHVLFSLSDGSSFLADEPFYAFENKLLLRDGFFKCGRSYIVNIHKCISFNQKEVTMSSGYRIPISRGYNKDFEEAYFSVFFEKAGEN